MGERAVRKHQWSYSALPTSRNEFQTITEEHVHMEVNLLDNRPRKMLEYKRPNNIFFEVPSHYQTVSAIQVKME